jgi:uncharacterized protein
MSEYKERVRQLIEEYKLQPHPEGGWYKETYRSEGSNVYDHGQRSHATGILFLLTEENCSCFHSIQSDELWFFHEGNPFTVHTLSNGNYSKMVLGNTSDSAYQGLVPAKTIFGSNVEKGYAFVSCVVAPGFDFEDFKLFSKEELMVEYAQFEKIITQLT